MVSGLLALAALVAVPAQAQQYARPDSTISAATWTAIPGGTLHDAVNEATADDNDYISSGNGNSTTVILGLSDVSDPGTHVDHILRYRCQASGGGGGPERCNAALYENNTLIADNGNVTANRGAFAGYTYTLSEAEAAAITDYTSLQIRLTSSVGNGESIEISWVELQVPSASQ